MFYVISTQTKREHQSNFTQTHKDKRTKAHVYAISQTHSNARTHTQTKTTAGPDAATADACSHPLASNTQRQSSQARTKAQKHTITQTHTNKKRPTDAAAADACSRPLTPARAQNTQRQVRKRTYSQSRKSTQTQIHITHKNNGYLTQQRQTPASLKHNDKHASAHKSKRARR